MSRWRESLCGKVVPSAVEPTASPSTMVNGQSEILSCGGSFLPHPNRHLLRGQKEIPALFHLPKGHYEVVMVRSEEELEYYGEETHALQEELDLIEGAIHDAGSKMHS